VEPNTQNKLNELEQKIDAVYTSVEKTRKYLLVIMWITIILFVLPLVAMIFVIPVFLNSYIGGLQGLL